MQHFEDMQHLQHFVGSATFGTLFKVFATFGNVFKTLQHLQHFVGFAIFATFFLNVLATFATFFFTTATFATFVRSLQHLQHFFKLCKILQHLKSLQYLQHFEGAATFANQSSDILQHSQNKPTGDRWLTFLNTTIHIIK